MEGQPSVRPARTYRRTRSRRRKTQHNEAMKDDRSTTEGKSTGETNEKDKRERILVKRSILKLLPVPVPQQLEALSNLLTLICAKNGMSKQDIHNRKMILQRFQQITIKEEKQDFALRLCGSSASCLGLKTSDVNIEVYKAEETRIPKIFIGFLNILKSSDGYSDVKEDFQTQTPAINFIDIKSGLTCRLISESHSSFLTSNLLKIYGELDNRVKPLCVALKFWAKICKVDRPACGTLPPYSFILMVVHFLQQTNPPVLPVIHEMWDESSIKTFIETQNSTQQFLTRIRSKWKPTLPNTECLGALWLGLLRYYTDEDKLEKIVVSLRYNDKCLRSSKNWGKKRFAIEDPFAIKRNVARTLTKSTYHRYIIEHLKVALVYFGTCPGSTVAIEEKLSQTSNESHHIEFGGIVPPVAVETEKGEDGCSSESDDGVGDNDEQVKRSDDQEDDEDDDDDEEDVVDDSDDSDVDGGDNGGDLTDGIFAMDTINDGPISQAGESGKSSTGTTVNYFQPSQGKVGLFTTSNDTINTVIERSDINWDSIEYNFDDSVLRKGPSLETRCSCCGDDSHIAENCEVEQDIPLTKLPELPLWFKDTLNKVCVCCANDFGITRAQTDHRYICMRELERYIRNKFPDARLHLFGSSCNGLGFKESDLDICMMFDGRKKSDIDCIKTITSLAKLLRLHQGIRDVIAITGAKVPIVKFFLSKPELEADISLYNEVALQNTKLLATYVQIDRRVHVLGCTLKVFVKLCEIGDASRGSLSSYAYILMLLHFLQQRQPPVIPVLQEIYSTKEMPTVIVDGCNCWFYGDIKNLGSKWKAKNTESCGELWLGFLRYYTEVFDFHRHVVCVRSIKPLTKFEKMWNGKKICIEDPFVLSHNLGAGLSVAMAKFILSTLVKARERFGIPSSDIPENGQMRQRFFFNPAVLNDGVLPPTGRNCNICGKIGHWAKECPYNKSHRREGKHDRKKNQTDKEKKIEKTKVEEIDKTVKNVNVSTAVHVRDSEKDGGPRPLNVTVTHPNVPNNPQQRMIPPSPPMRPTQPSRLMMMRHSSPFNQRGPVPNFVVRPASPNVMYPAPSRPLAPCFPLSPNFQTSHISFPKPAIGRPMNTGPPPVVIPRGAFPMNSAPFGQPLNSPPRQHAVIGLQQSPVARSRYAKITPVPITPLPGFLDSPPAPVISVGNSPNSTARMITCEALEKQTCDQTDDIHEELKGVSDIRHKNDGFSPTVIQSLHALNLNCFPKETIQFDRPITPPGKFASDRLNEKRDAQTLEHQQFSLPPQVQNVAEKSMYQSFDEFASSVKNSHPNSPVSPLLNSEQDVRPDEVGEKIVVEGEGDQNSTELDDASRPKGEKMDTAKDEEQQFNTKSGKRRRNRRRNKQKSFTQEVTGTSVADKPNAEAKEYQKQNMMQPENEDKRRATLAGDGRKEGFNGVNAVKTNSQTSKQTCRASSTAGEKDGKPPTQGKGTQKHADYHKPGTGSGDKKENGKNPGSSNKERFNSGGQRQDGVKTKTNIQTGKQSDKKPVNPSKEFIKDNDRIVTSKGKASIPPPTGKRQTAKTPGTSNKETTKNTDQRPTSGKKGANAWNNKKQETAKEQFVRDVGHNKTGAKTGGNVKDMKTDTGQPPREQERTGNISASLVVKIEGQDKREVFVKGGENSGMNEQGEQARRKRPRRRKPRSGRNNTPSHDQGNPDNT